MEVIVMGATIISDEAIRAAAADISIAIVASAFIRGFLNK